jgi:hypothetical protein
MRLQLVADHCWATLIGVLNVVDVEAASMWTLLPQKGRPVAHTYDTFEDALGEPAAPIMGEQAMFVVSVCIFNIPCGL